MHGLNAWRDSLVGKRGGEGEGTVTLRETILKMSVTHLLISNGISQLRFKFHSIFIHSTCKISVSLFYRRGPLSDPITMKARLGNQTLGLLQHQLDFFPYFLFAEKEGMFGVSLEISRFQWHALHITRKFYKYNEDSNCSKFKNLRTTKFFWYKIDRNKSFNVATEH